MTPVWSVQTDILTFPFQYKRIFRMGAALYIWNIPPEHTPDPQLPVYEENPFICVFWGTWGLFQARWWFQIIFMFIPIWGNDPVWRAYFSDGWFNHQLAGICWNFLRGHLSTAKKSSTHLTSIWQRSVEINFPWLIWDLGPLPYMAMKMAENGCWTKNIGKPPKSSILIGFGTIIFTIHFGIPLLLETSIYGGDPNYLQVLGWSMTLKKPYKNRGIWGPKVPGLGQSRSLPELHHRNQRVTVGHHGWSLW